MTDAPESFRRALQATAEQRHRAIDRDQARLLRETAEVLRGIRCHVECFCVVSGVPNALCETCRGLGTVDVP